LDGLRKLLPYICNGYAVKCHIAPPKKNLSPVICTIILEKSISGNLVLSVVAASLLQVRTECESGNSFVLSADFFGKERKTEKNR
jgi:hypothetical protein